MSRLNHIAFAIFIVITGAGCAENSTPIEEATNPVTAKPPKNELEVALCNQNYAFATLALDASDLNLAESAFWRGYILEMTGQVMHASAIYEALTIQDKDKAISLNCDDIIMASGLISEEAFKRLAVIKNKLVALDANFTPKKIPTHKGLPKSAPIEAPEPTVIAIEETDTVTKASQNVNTPAPSGLKIKPLIVEVPASQSDTGGWFAHFSSYGSAENADSYLTVLEGKYPALTGVIEKWQISTATGSAWRLGVRADEWSDVDRLCVVIRSKGDYCRVIDTNQ